MKKLLLLILLPVMAFAADPQVLKRSEPFGSVSIQPQQKRVALSAEDGLRLKAEKGDASAMFGLSKMLQKQGRREEARSWLEKASALKHPAAIVLHFSLDDVNHETERRLSRDFVDIIENNPENKNKFAHLSIYNKILAKLAASENVQVHAEADPVVHKDQDFIGLIAPSWSGSSLLDDALQSQLYPERWQEASVDFADDGYENYAEQNSDTETAMEEQGIFATLNAHLPDTPVVMVLGDSGDECERVDTDNHQTIIDVRSSDEDVSVLEMQPAPKKTGRKKQKQPAQQSQSTSSSQPYKKVRVVRVLGADKQIGRDSLAIEQRKNQLLQQEEEAEASSNAGQADPIEVDSTPSQVLKIVIAEQDFFAAANAHLPDGPVVMMLDDSDDESERVDTDNHQPIIDVRSSDEDVSAIEVQEVQKAVQAQPAQQSQSSSSSCKARPSGIDAIPGFGEFILAQHAEGVSTRKIANNWNGQDGRRDKDRRSQSIISAWLKKQKQLMPQSQSFSSSRKVVASVEEIPGAEKFIEKILALDKHNDLTLVPLYGIIYQTFADYKISMKGLCQWLQTKDLLKIDASSRLEVDRELFDSIETKLTKANIGLAWENSSRKSMSRSMMHFYVKMVKLVTDKQDLLSVSSNGPGKYVQLANSKFTYFNVIIKSYCGYFPFFDKDDPDAESSLAQSIEGLSYRKNRKTGNRAFIPELNEFIVEQHQQGHTYKEIASLCKDRFGITRSNWSIARLIQEYAKARAEPDKEAEASSSMGQADPMEIDSTDQELDDDASYASDYQEQDLDEEE